MGGVSERPFPAGEYDVVVVGSGPGGLQTSYFLSRRGVGHAVISADEAPGGMFRAWPIYQRLLSSSKPDAPFPRMSREYERYDQNSLLAEEPALRALVPGLMDRAFAVPSRSEMEAGLVAFAEGAGVQVRYGCRWEATRREADGRLALETSAGLYTCQAAVFAVGVTDPWKPDIPGIEDVPHYAEAGEARSYEGKSVLIVGKRNSGFELADALLPWASEIAVASPSGVRTAALARSSVDIRYFQPLADGAVGGGTLVLDATIERIERTAAGYRVSCHDTAGAGEFTLERDVVIAATGFTTPFNDLLDLGVTAVARGRIPALTPLFESTSAPGVFFAGNASQGAFGLRKDGTFPYSAGVVGFRYNARILAEHLAEQLGCWSRPPGDELGPEAAASLLSSELARAPELWMQKGYLARVLSLDGDRARDEGILPLEHFVDSTDGDAVAATIEVDAGGNVYPVVYVRRGGRVKETSLEPHPLRAFDAPSYRQELELLLA